MVLGMASPAAPVALPSPVAANAASGGPDSVMDDLLAQYLRRRGYHVAPANASASADVDMESGLKQEHSASAASPMNVESSGRSDSAEPTTIEEYAHSLGLTTQSCAANHLVRALSLSLYTNRVYVVRTSPSHTCDL